MHGPLLYYEYIIAVYYTTFLFEVCRPEKLKGDANISRIHYLFVISSMTAEILVEWKYHDFSLIIIFRIQGNSQWDDILAFFRSKSGLIGPHWLCHLSAGGSLEGIWVWKVFLKSAIKHASGIKMRYRMSLSSKEILFAFLRCLLSITYSTYNLWFACRNWS